MFGASFKAANILDKDMVKYLYGTYGSVLDFRNLIPTITMSLGVSALPAISAAWALKDQKSIKITIESVLRVTMLVALPAGIGMAVLSNQILTIVYGGSNADIIPIAAPIMATYGYATALMALSTPITNLLQGIGRTDIPVKSLLVGAMIKISCNYIIVGNPHYNINGAPFGSILCYIAIVCINLFSLLKISRVRINIVSIFIKPLFCSGLCGATAWAMYGLSFRLFEKINLFSNHLVFISTIISIMFAAIVYSISLLLIKGISKDDITMLPKGEKIAKVLAKYGLLG
jgi:stage V sporulation protein B